MSEADRRPRLFLVHGPTPIVRRPALDAIVGAEVWIKRDDMTGGAEAGNKLRKLEWLLADALAKKARAVITCGGIQSNHARATALVCAQLGLSPFLFLRVPDPRTATLPATGNVLLDRLAGAHVHFVSPEEYRARAAVMEEARVGLAREGIDAYVVPEGGSNGLGALGYVEAMREVREQMDLGLAGDASFDIVAHACGSGGTAAGVVLGAARWGVAREVWAFAVSDDAATFEAAIARIVVEARAYDDSLQGQAHLVVDDRAKGPAYGVMAEEQKAFLVRVARATGIVLDPVYTGKALFGVMKAVERGAIAKNARVLFLHTGGLPGLLAQGGALESSL